jgi:hypothetical protein
LHRAPGSIFAVKVSCRDIKVDSKNRGLAATHLASNKKNNLALLKVLRTQYVFALHDSSPFLPEKLLWLAFSLAKITTPLQN